MAVNKDLGIVKARLAAITCGSIFLIGAALAADVPTILISPIKKSKTGPEPNLSIANYLSQDLDQDGRVKPVVWGYGDPTFRDAALDGKIQRAGSPPDLQGSLDAAEALRAHYVLLYSTGTKGASLTGHAELYVDGRLKWKNDQQLATKHGADVLVDDAAASIAHSWALLMEGDAFRQLKANPKNITPAAAPGQAPPVVVPNPTPPPVATAESVTEFQNEVKALQDNGKIDQALIRARDAIDAHPLSPELRLVLVHLLESQGQMAEAAQQAAHASDLMPENHELRLAAIRDLLASGQQTEAKLQLNEILAREPHDSSTLLLQGQTYLAVGRPDEALSAIDHLLDEAPSPQAVYWRAVTRTVLGGADGVLEDAATYQKAPMKPDQVVHDYPLAMDVIATATRKSFEDVLNLFALANSDSQAGEVHRRLDDLSRGAEARANFLSGFTPPDSCKKSNAERLLAQKLLDVCLADLQDFAKTNSEESITDARINLGEAMKQSKAADLALAVERGLPGHGGSTTTSG